MKQITNNLSEIIKTNYDDKGMKFSPTNEWYKTIGIGKKRFAKMLSNEQQPDLIELLALSQYFQVGISDLYTTK